MDQGVGLSIGFPGQYYDAESGLWQNWYRYYDSSLGRYTSSDPLGLLVSVNTYAYVDHSPITQSDPDGRNPVHAIITSWRAGTTIGEALLPLVDAPLSALVLKAFGDPLAWVDSDPLFKKTPNKGKPGSCHVNPGSGQERKYGADGLPEYDIDWDHNHGQGEPHGHNWGRGPNGEPIRGAGVPVSPWPRGRGVGG